LLLSGTGRSPFAVAPGIDKGNGVANGYDLALLGQDLPENAALDGRYLGVNLIRGHFQYRFVLFDVVTHLFKPFQYCPLHDTFSHFGHQDFNECHISVLLFILVIRKDRLHFRPCRFLAPKV
jgi:hypothetical protein